MISSVFVKYQYRECVVKLCRRIALREFGLKLLIHTSWKEQRFQCLINNLCLQKCVRVKLTIYVSQVWSVLTIASKDSQIKNQKLLSHGLVLVAEDTQFCSDAEAYQNKFGLNFLLRLSITVSQQSGNVDNSLCNDAQYWWSRRWFLLV